MKMHPAKRARIEVEDDHKVELQYMPGFGFSPTLHRLVLRVLFFRSIRDNRFSCRNHFSSEALPNALPDGQNNPQRVSMNFECPVLALEVLTCLCRTSARMDFMPNSFREQPSLHHVTTTAAGKSCTCLFWASYSR
jgi:hypothetical protein